MLARYVAAGLPCACVASCDACPSRGCSTRLVTRCPRLVTRCGGRDESAASSDQSTAKAVLHSTDSSTARRLPPQHAVWRGMLRGMPIDPDIPGFSVRAALDAGATVSQLRHPSLAMPTAGARVPADLAASDPRAALLAALRPLIRDDQFFSHTTAARLHGMPLPGRLVDDPIHLASPSFTVRSRREGVVGHRIKATVVEVDGIRVESIADTFVHLGTAGLALEELVEVGDWIVHPDRRDPISPSDLLAHARQFTGARGITRVVAAIPLLRSGADSPGETRTRLLIRGAGLPEPVLQHPVHDDRGRLVATLDLAYPELHVGFEHEGAHHFANAEQYAYDIRRYAALESMGWRILRVTHADIRDRGARLIPLIRAARRESGHPMR